MADQGRAAQRRARIFSASVWQGGHDEAAPLAIGSCLASKREHASLSTAKHPHPQIGSSASNPDLKPYWEACSNGRLLYRRCIACGEAHWYPRPFCPFCFGATEWQEASGEGEIYSLSVTSDPEAPYAIAYVRLPEGFTMMTNIVDANLDRLVIGQKVKVKFAATDQDMSVPVFAPLGVA